MITKLSSSPTPSLPLIVVLIISLNVGSCRCKNDQQAQAGDPPGAGIFQGGETVIHKHKSVGLLLTSNSKKLTDSKPLQLTIKNTGSNPSEAGKLKLKIIRTEGESASIVDAVKKDGGYA